jgi:hypothetical protein
VASVPTIKGKAPNCLSGGDHTFVIKKFKPNALIDGMEFKTRERKIARKRIIMHNPEKKRNFLKTTSPENLFPLICIFL